MDYCGYNGQILKCDVSKKEYTVEKPDHRVYRRYMGGRNLGLYFLLKELPAGIDPFSPGNILSFMTSVVTGAPISGQGRHTISAKSPLTGGLGEAQCGGFWGPELKFAGYDGLLLYDRSEKPIYIYINDDTVQFLPADELWGHETGYVDRQLRERHGDAARICQIGPAGENGVRYAVISHDLHHFAGRSGLGAVMGSKNVKAVVVKASKRDIRLADSEKLKSISSWFAKSTKVHPAITVHHELGTAKGVVPLSTMGLLPTYNFQDGSFDHAEEVSGETMKERIGAGTNTCYRCAVACKRVVKGEDGDFKVGKVQGGPEYESLCALGPLVGVDNIVAIAQSNELCNSLGLDTISTGVTIAWAVECFERGLLTTEDTGGIELTWNDPGTYHKLIEQIADRDGFGALLAEGSLRASRTIGRDTERFAMQSKGQEFPSHEPRGKWGVALGYAVSPTGADHLQAAHDVWFDKPGDNSAEFSYVDLEDLSSLGILEPVPSEDLGPSKVRLFVYLQYVWSLHDVLNWCIFTAVPEFRAIRLNQFTDIVHAVTGWDTSLFELLKAGERGITMARAFNCREGFTSKNDTLPERLFEPLRDGALEGHKIDRDQFAKALQLYYGMMGWSDKGVPTKAKLAELGVEWIGERISS